jgi:hypothetical protein
MYWIARLLNELLYPAMPVPVEAQRDEALRRQAAGRRGVRPQPRG